MTWRLSSRVRQAFQPEGSARAIGPEARTCSIPPAGSGLLRMETKKKSRDGNLKALKP